MAPSNTEVSSVYAKLLDLTKKHAEPSSLEEILAIRHPDAIHAWGHNYLISLNPKLGERMDNVAFKAHLTSTGPYLDSSGCKIHSITVDEHQRTSSLHMSYFLRPTGSDVTVEQDLIWTLKFSPDEDPDKILITETVEFIDAAASSRVGEVIREINGEVSDDVRGGITLRGY